MATKICHKVMQHERIYSDGVHAIATVGRYTYGDFCIHRAQEKCQLFIGRYCSIANEVQFFLGQEHHTDWGTTYPFPALPKEWHGLEKEIDHNKTRGDILVGNDVWIGYGALIRSGVTIGDGAVVGMGSVVTRDIPPYAIAAGNPARVVRYRFEKDVCKALLELSWWDCPDAVIREIAPLLCSPFDRSHLEELRIILTK